MSNCPGCGKLVQPPAFCLSCGVFVDSPPGTTRAPQHFVVTTLTKEQSEILSRGWQPAEAAVPTLTQAVPTVTQALTHAPSDRDTVTGAPSGGALMPLHLPYRWGTFVGWGQVLWGIGCMIIGISQYTAGDGLSGIMVGTGIPWIMLGYGVLRRKKLAVILMLGLQGLANVALITRNFANVIGLALYIPNLIYFVNRMDEMD